MDITIPFTDPNGSFGSYGISLSTALTLSRNPVVNNEVATKQYVDNKFIGINATRITSDILTKERFGDFVGEILSDTNTGYTSLSNIVQQGIYCKVSVNGSGRVVEGFNLSQDDIPSLSWNKVTNNVPVDLFGYGITNGITKTGDAVEGFITLSAIPTENNHAVTKNYVDTVLNTGGGNNSVPVEYPPGTIIRTSSNNPSSKTGFLLCNGGNVSKTLYSDLYAIIANRFSYLDIPSVTPWYNQYLFNNEISVFSSSAELTAQETDGISINKNQLYIINNTIITKGKIYVFTTVRKDITNFPNNGKIFSKGILPSGEIDPNDTWIEETSSYNFPLVKYSTLFMIKNKIYLVGGLLDYYPNDNEVNNVLYCYIWKTTINLNGSLNDFERVGKLPFHMKEFQVVQVFDKLYFLSGRYRDGGSINYDQFDKLITIYINTAGDIKKQSIDDDGLFIPKYNIREMYINSEQRPLCIQYSSIAATKAGIFVIGGYRYNDNYNLVPLYDTKIIKLALNEQGNVTTIEPINIQFPINNNFIYNVALVQTKNNIYLLFGKTFHKENASFETITYNYLDEMYGSTVYNWSNKIYKLDLDSNGDITNWVEHKEVTNTVLENTTYNYPDVISTSSKLYFCINNSNALFSIYGLDFSGGYNDYTITNSNLVDTSGPTFRLPDFTNDLNRVYYIRY